MPPNRAHLLGADLFGRDVFSRLLYGGRLTLGMGLLAAAVAALPGLDYNRKPAKRWEGADFAGGRLLERTL